MKVTETELGLAWTNTSDVGHIKGRSRRMIMNYSTTYQHDSSFGRIFWSFPADLTMTLKITIQIIFIQRIIFIIKFSNVTFLVMSWYYHDMINLTKLSSPATENIIQNIIRLNLPIVLNVCVITKILSMPIPRRRKGITKKKKQSQSKNTKA